MSVSKKIATRECCDLTFATYTSKTPFLTLDYALTTTTEMQADTVYATGGRGNPQRIPFHGSRTGTIGFTTQIVPFKLYSLLSGAAIDSTATFIKREVLAASTDTLTLTSAPVAGTLVVYAEGDEYGDAVTTTVTGTTVTLPESSTGNFIAWYVETISSNVQKVSITSTTFPQEYTVYAETVSKTEDGEIVPYKMIAYKCSPQGIFSLSLSNSGDPMTLEFTADLLANDDGKMLDLILIEEDTSV